MVLNLLAALVHTPAQREAVLGTLIDDRKEKRKRKLDVPEAGGAAEKGYGESKLIRWIGRDDLMSRLLTIMGLVEGLDSRVRTSFGRSPTSALRAWKLKLVFRLFRSPSSPSISSGPLNLPPSSHLFRYANVAQSCYLSNSSSRLTLTSSSQEQHSACFQEAVVLQLIVLDPVKADVVIPFSCSACHRTFRPTRLHPITSSSRQKTVCSISSSSTHWARSPRPPSQQRSSYALASFLVSYLSYSILLEMVLKSFY
jgi:hypothetical protein